MNKFLLGAAAITVFAAACNKESNMLNNNDQRDASSLSKTTFTGIDTIGGVVHTGDTLKLDSDTLYYLNSKLYIANGAVITIEPGTRIEGIKKATAAEAVAIIVTRGGKIYANGTADKPIIMTAATYPNAQPGDWGGVVLLGNGVTNRTANTSIEGINLPSVPTGIDVTYGGPNGTVVNDNSGIFQYVRIEYAGAAISANNELNAFTCGGVGNGTQINHVMSSLGADDGFEFFGGNFNPSYLVSYACNDDQFDFDHGYRGRLQFCVGYINPIVAYSSDPNGIESDNDATGTAIAPYTQPNISNMTLIGTQTLAINNTKGILYGARFRRRSSYVLRNSVILGYKTNVVLESDTAQNRSKNIAYNVFGTLDDLTPGNMVGRAIWGNTSTPGSNKYYNTDSLAAALGYTADANKYGVSAASKLLVNPFPIGINALVSGLEPNYSGVKTGANFTGMLGFQIVTFKGAVGVLNDNWLVENWVDFTP